MQEIISDLKILGFDIEFFGNTTFVIHVMPADLTEENETQLIENLLEEFKNSAKSEQCDKRKNVPKTMYYQTAIKYLQN